VTAQYFTARSPTAAFWQQAPQKPSALIFQAQLSIKEQVCHLGGERFGELQARLRTSPPDRTSVTS